MKVNLVFEGIPGVAKVVGKRVFEFDLGGHTVADLLIVAGADAIPKAGNLILIS